MAVTPVVPPEDDALVTNADLAQVDSGYADAIARSRSAGSARDAREALGEDESSSHSRGLGGWWKVFASTYVTIFLAEIGDKTQVTTLLLSAKSHKPWVVFAGAGTALVCTSLLGVLLGRWLATRLKPRTLELGAGITLLVITAGLGWDIYQGL